MKRKIKKGSSVYVYLDAIGVLEKGSSDDIERHKKIYWANVRKAWKKAKLQECKSFTIFFSPVELKVITQSIKNRKLSVTAYIKQAALSASKNKSVVDRIAVGEVREAVMLHYNTIQRLGEEKEISQTIASELLQHARIIETKTIAFLQQY